MDFDALMAQARANEEQGKKTKVKKPCNLEPGRSTQKLRADLVRNKEEEKRRKIAEEERFGRQEREKLAKMEAQMAEHERKLKEEQEKLDKLDQIHREAQERKAKMEAEQQAKRDAIRQEQDRKREEERQKKLSARAEKMGDFIDDDNDIFKRRQRDLDEKKRRREQRKKDDIWRRREEHKRGMKDRDKEKLMAKIREDAKKVAMSLSKGTPGREDTPEKKKKRTSSSSTSRLLDIEESAYMERKRARKEKRAELKKELRTRRASEIESRAETSSSSEGEITTKPPRQRRRVSPGVRDTPTSHTGENETQGAADRNRRSHSREKPEVRSENGDVENVTSPSGGLSQEKPKVSDILGGNVDTAALSAALNHFIKFPSGPLAEISDAEYDSHEEQNNRSPLAPLYKPTNSVTSEAQYSPLDSVFSESLTSQTLSSQTLTSQTLTSQTSLPHRGSDSVFKETLVSETTYSPRNIQGDAPCLSYSPSVIPAKYSPENFSDLKSNIEYIPSSVNEAGLDAIPYTPGPSKYTSVDYTPTCEMLTSETQSMEYAPALSSVLDNSEYVPAMNVTQENSEYIPAMSAAQDNLEYSPAPIQTSTNIEISPQPSAFTPNTSEAAPSEGFMSPCTLQSETVYSPYPPTADSPTTPQSETVYTSAYLQSETVTSPSALKTQPTSATLTNSPDNNQHETLVSETVTSSPSQFVFSPSKITPSLDNFCYSPLKNEEMDLLKSPNSQDSSKTTKQTDRTGGLENEPEYYPQKISATHHNNGEINTRISSETQNSNQDRTEAENSPNGNGPMNNRTQEDGVMEEKYSPERVETETHYSPSRPAVSGDAQYSPGTVESNVHYSPCPQYVPEHITNETTLICYTPARPIRTGTQCEVEMAPNETEMPCETMPAYEGEDQNEVELTPNETEMFCDATPKQGVTEMTPNETEMNCEMTPDPSENMTPTQNEVNYNESESDEIGSDKDSEAGQRKSRKRVLSDSSEEKVSNSWKPESKKVGEQEKLQELFGDTDSESEEKKKESESEDDSRKKQYESEEEDSPVKKAQERRNKLKELARKKNRHASSDSLSDYDHKVYDSDDVAESKHEKPKTFEELLAVANQKNEENKKELELRKQKEQRMQQQRKEKEAKRKELRDEFERKKRQAEIDKEREKRREALKREEEKRLQEQKKEERAKNRIPKVSHTAESDKSRPDKQTNKQSDGTKQNNTKQVESKHSFKVPRPNGSSDHPNKRKKTSAPIRPDPSGSFEELMKMAQNNSKQGIFGANIRRPEDVIRDQKKREAQRERDKQQFLNFKPSVPLPPPKAKHPPPRPSTHRPDSHRSTKPANREDKHPPNRAPRSDHLEDRRSRERGKEQRKEQRSSDREQKDMEREQRRMKEAKRRQDKPRKKLHINPYMDDDLDDFVVDDDENVDYSKAVRSIFGYDKRKYRDEDDDCRDMETDYRTIAKEEARSARLAKQEDAEELKKILAEEERERKRKMKR